MRRKKTSNAFRTDRKSGWNTRLFSVFRDFTPAPQVTTPGFSCGSTTEKEKWPPYNVMVILFVWLHSIFCRCIPAELLIFSVLTKLPSFSSMEFLLAPDKTWLLDGAHRAPDFGSGTSWYIRWHCSWCIWWCGCDFQSWTLYFSSFVII